MMVLHDHEACRYCLPSHHSDSVCLRPYLHLSMGLKVTSHSVGCIFFVGADGADNVTANTDVETSALIHKPLKDGK